MKIQVLGSGCPTCKKLLDTTKKVVQELGIDAEVEYVTDMSKIIEMGVMTTPTLAVNGKPILSGGGKNADEIKKVLQNILEKDDNVRCGCGCKN